jgi:hypothetical protein
MLGDLDGESLGEVAGDLDGRDSGETLSEMLGDLDGKPPGEAVGDLYEDLDDSGGDGGRLGWKDLENSLLVRQWEASMGPPDFNAQSSSSVCQRTVAGRDFR